MKVKLTVLIALIGLMSFPFPSVAVEMNITSSTQYLWYTDMIAEDDVDAVAQYLRLNVAKMDSAGKVTIAGYGRAMRQFSTGEDVDGRLYYFFLDYRDMVQDVLDVKLGRHFMYTPSGSGIIDGATLDFKGIGPLGIKLIGGRDVRFLAERNEVTGGKDRTLAASLYTDAIKLTHMEASYMRRLDDGDVSRELIGASFSTYLVRQMSVYADTKYDTLTASTAELLAGIKFAPVEKLTAKVEYYQSFPTFDATSIYSVFAVNKYTETLLKAEFQATAAYRISAGYAKEDFNDDADADLYEVGLFARPFDGLMLNVCYTVRNGYSGELDGIRLDGTYAMGKNSLSAGMDFADYRRDSTTDNTVKKYWVGAAHNFTKDVSLTARVENSVNVNYTHNYQGAVALNANF